MPSIDDTPHVYDVFRQTGGSGKPIQYVGRVRGADPELAWQSAKEVFTRREDCTLLWVVPRSSVMRSGPEDEIVLKGGSTRRYRVPGYPSGHRRARNRTTTDPVLPEVP